MRHTFIRWTNRNLSMQGYGSLGEDERRSLALALRLSPALCLLGMTLGVVLRSPILLIVMAVTAFAGGFVTAKHPFDLLWDHGLRHLSGAPPLQRTPPPRRFACQLATPWLLAIAAAFLADADTVAVVLAVPLLAVATTVTVTNWCLPSLIHGLIHGSRDARPRTAA
jgi:hypothetical protein